MKIERMSELPPEERPRERLARGGVRSLSDAELLAIFIRTGTAGRDALAVARELLSRYGNLHGIACCSFEELRRSVKGIGLAKASELAAIFEIGRRLAQGPGLRPKLDRPEAIYDLLSPDMQILRREVLRVLLLNTKYELLAMEEVSAGSLNESVAHPREILRPALIHAAYAFILAHNHPSGDPSPSEADRRITIRLQQASDTMGIKMLDHVIIGSQKEGFAGYFSFREAGLL